MSYMAGNTQMLMCNSYCRVIPRDFFNESKLLKCMGLLALKILDGNLPKGIKITIDECEEPFKIDFLGEGSLTIANYPVTANEQNVVMKTTYNSKANYPLFCEIGDSECLVFDEKGDFHNDFIEKFYLEDKDD